MIKIMMEDDSQNIRKEIVSSIEFNEKTIPYLVIKT